MYDYWVLRWFFFDAWKSGKRLGPLRRKWKKSTTLVGRGYPEIIPIMGWSSKYLQNPSNPKLSTTSGLPRWCGAGVSVAGGSVPTDVVVGFRIHDSQPEFILYQRRGGRKGLGKGWDFIFLKVFLWIFLEGMGIFVEGFFLSWIVFCRGDFSCKRLPCTMPVLHHQLIGWDGKVYYCIPPKM